MSVFRCMDEESTYRFFESCGWDSLAPDEVYVLVGKVGRYGGSVRIPISGCMETILRIDAPTPLKELLCAAIREGLSEYGHRSKELTSACIRDKLESRQAKGLSNDSLFGARMVCLGWFELPEGLKEIVCHDSV